MAGTPSREAPGTLRHVFMTLKTSKVRLRRLNEYLNDRYGAKSGFKGFRAALESLFDGWKEECIGWIEAEMEPKHAAGEPLCVDENCEILTWVDPTDGRIYTQEVCYGPMGEIICEGVVMCQQPMGMVVDEPNATYEHVEPFSPDPSKLKRDDTVPPWKRGGGGGAGGPKG